MCNDDHDHDDDDRDDDRDTDSRCVYKDICIQCDGEGAVTLEDGIEILCQSCAGNGTRYYLD